MGNAAAAGIWRSPLRAHFIFCIFCVFARLLASATAGITTLCLLLAVAAVSRLPANRTEAINLGYQHGDPQAQKAPVTTVLLQQKLGVTKAKEQKAKGTKVAKSESHWKPWEPLSAEKLFHRKGVHFKGFNAHKAAMLRRAKQQAKKQGEQKLWIQPDNGVYTTINVRGMADPEGGIKYNSNFVYGPPGIIYI